MFKNRRMLIIVTGITVLILSGGAGFIYWAVRYLDSQKKELLINKMPLVAEAVSIGIIKSIYDENGNIDNPNIKRLRSKLNAVKQFDKKKSNVYLTIRKPSGDFVVITDNDSQNPSFSVSEKERLQKRLNDNFLPSLHQILDTGKPIVAGPFEYSGCKLVSVWMPISNMRSAKPFAILGIDIDVTNWEKELFVDVLPTVIALFSLVLIVWLGFFLFRYRSRQKGRVIVPLMHLEETVTTLFGICLTFVAAWTANHVERHSRSLAFVQLAESRMHAIADAMQDLSNIEFEGISRFFEGSENVTADEFRHYAAYLVQNPMTSAWQWIPVVSDKDRARFEAGENQWALGELDIWQKNKSEQRKPSEKRDLYYPLVHVAPYNENAHLIGFDLGSIPELRTAINLAYTTGRPTASAPITEEATDKKTIYVFRPVFKTYPNRTLSGFVAAVIDLDEMIKIAGNDWNTYLDITLIQDNGEENLLASNYSASTTISKELTLTRQVTAFGKVFNLHVYAGDGFLHIYPMQNWIFVSAIGFLLTFAVTLLLGIILKRRAELEHLVAERTAKLRESEERGTATLRSIGDGVIACNSEQKIISLNHTAEKLTGWLSHDAVGRKVEEVFNIVDVKTGETAENFLSKSLNENVIIEPSNHTAIISTNGQKRQISSNCAPIRDESGAVIGGVLAFRDVTEDYKKREELAEERKRIEYVLSITKTSFNIIDSDYNLKYVDPASQEIYGDPTGKKCYTYFSELKEPCPTCASAAALKLKTPITREKVLTKENNRITEVHSIPMQDADGQWLIAEFKVDITERKQAEESREKLQAQLNHAQKMESIGRLAGGVAHDFNNMLGVILGYADLAVGKLDANKELLGDLVEIRRAAQRSADLTRQLLAFARKQTVTPKVLNLNETVEGMLNMLRRLIGEDLALVWHPGPADVQINMDPSQIDQILANLCVNAKDAVSVGGKIVITTETFTVDKDYSGPHTEAVHGKYALLSVSDNGIGMSSEIIARLFEPFFTTKELGKGTGLGLATVYGIVKQNGGFIEVESEPGKGASFKIFLPQYIEKNTELPKIQLIEEPAFIVETILLVEDEPAILKMTALMLEKLGHTVLPASTPKEALRIATDYSGEIHLLMTDVIMPEMNGHNLKATVLKIRPDIKCLFMSGYTADVIAEGDMLQEGVFFIQKPFTMRSLSDSINKVLE